MTDLQFFALALIGFVVLCACALCVFTLAIDPVIEDERL